MRFLIDRCAGHMLAEWLRIHGHNVTEAAQRSPDPGDKALLEWAAAEQRILVTIDKDFGALVHMGHANHAGLVRLPDVSAKQRITIFTQLLQKHKDDLENGAIITVRGGRIRVSRKRP